MMKRILGFWPIILLTLVTITVALTNYKTGTYLIGWDNLQTELNVWLNITRAIFSVWEEYQGLGLLAGMAHASDLPRQILVGIFSIVLPQSLVRYAYNFLMVGVGMVGVYVFLSNIVFKENAHRKFAASLGALFYLCNLGTIQYFYVPFEPYSTFWGMFPWEMYSLFLYLFAPTKKRLWIFIIISILSVSQAVVQTIFLVYLLCVGLVFGVYLFSEKSKIALKRCISIGLIIFAINAFWLLPNLYFTLTSLHVTQDAMQNQMATEKFFQMNKNRGTLLDFPLLREFYYDFFDYNNSTNAFDFLLKSWRTYYSLPATQIFGYLLFFVTVFGLLQKNKFRKYFIALFLLCALIFLSNTPVFAQLNNIFRAIPVVNQIFRNPFTKFIVPTIFIFSVGFGIAMSRFFDFLVSQKRATLSTGAFVIVLLLLLFYSHPIFQGDFIAKQMRQKLPAEYQQLFTYLNSQDENARIMNMPQASFWGWEYYNWGLHGSGFLWYGVKQPILDRAFDVWSSQDENYYWQLAYAINKHDQSLFNSMLEKYQVRYILFDSNLIFGANGTSAKSGFEQKSLLDTDNKVSVVKRFGSLTLYKVDLQTNFTNNVGFYTSLPGTTSKPEFELKDNTYLQTGNYYGANSDASSIISPFDSLFSSRFQSEHNYQISDTATTYTITAPIPKGNYVVNIPQYRQSEAKILTKLYARRQGNSVQFRADEIPPTITVGNTTVKTTPASTTFAASLPSDISSFFIDVNNADYFLVKNLGQDYTVVGDVYLQNANLSNYIQLYADANAITQLLSTSNFSTAHTCGSTGNNTLTSSSADQSQLNIQAKNTAGCAVYDGAVPSQNALMQVSFTYKSQTDEYPQFCYYTQSAHTCINKKDIISSGFSKAPTKYSAFFEGDQVPNDQIYFQMILEAQSDEDKNELKQISYSNISITAYPYISGGTINLADFQDINNLTPVSLTSPSTIKATFLKENNSSSYVDPIANHIYKTSPLNYDKEMPGDFHLEQAYQNKINLALKTTDASSYLLFRANNLSGQQGYIVKAESKNIAGFPLTVNIFTNEDFRTYLYTFAQKSNSLFTNYFVLPPIYPFDKGIDLLLGSTSYNSQETINGVRDVSFYPLPYNIITGITLLRDTGDVEGMLRPSSTEKKNYSLYVVNTLPPNAKFMVLSQSFDSGWHAYQVASDNFWTETFPFIFGKKLTNHVEINNWENGWVVSKTNGPVIIVYLPQYLEYIGFLLLAGIICWALGYKIAKEKTPQN